jgi:hypothetical protein
MRGIGVLHPFSGCLHMRYFEEPAVKQTNLAKCNYGKLIKSINVDVLVTIALGPTPSDQ